jgi:hypothetical protein
VEQYAEYLRNPSPIGRISQILQTAEQGPSNRRSGLRSPAAALRGWDPDGKGFVIVGAPVAYDCTIAISFAHAEFPTWIGRRAAGRASFNQSRFEGRSKRRFFRGSVEADPPLRR